MARNTKAKSAKEAMADYRHDEAKRKNNPPAKIAAEGAVPPLPKIEYVLHPAAAARFAIRSYRRAE